MSTPAPSLVDVFRCTQCAKILSADNLFDDRLYECGECGERSEERRCESCNKFSARVHEPACPDDYADCEQFEAAVDNDGALIDPDDWQPEGTAAERDAEKAAAAAAAREAADAQRANELDAATIPTHWADVQPGQCILMESKYDEPGAAPVWLVQQRPDGLLQVTVWRYSMQMLVVSADDVVRVFRETPELRRVPEPPRGAWIDETGDSSVFSTPNRQGRVTVGTYIDGPRSPARVTAVSIVLGHHRHGIQHRIATWISRRQMLADLAVFERAAEQLAARTGQSIDPDAKATDVLTVEDHVSGNLPIQVKVSVVEDDFEDRHVVGFETYTSQSSLHSAAVADPSLLAALCAAARELADQLPD